jgi:hypothetical protein
MEDNDTRRYSRYLIGPALFETYILVLKIVLLATGIGLLIATSIQLAGLGGESFIDTGSTVQVIAQAVARIFGNIWSGMLSAFAMVTIIFALVEHFTSDADLEKIRSEMLVASEALAPGKSQDLPLDKLRIKRSDPIVNLIFSLIFLIIINTMPDIFGLYRQGNSGMQITGFLGEGFKDHLLWINIALIFGMSLEVVKLARGRWTWFQIGAGLVQNAVSFVVTLRVVRDAGFINPRFVTEVNRLLTDGGASRIPSWSGKLITALTVIVILGFVIDTLTIASKSRFLLKKSG